MTFWPNDLDNDNLHRLGPFIDGFVGTDGKYSDLYEAVNTGGWSRIILAAGATLSADLTLTGSDGFIVSLFAAGALSLGGRKITVQGDDWHLRGFKLDTPPAVGIEIQGGVCVLKDIEVVSAGSHAFYFNTSYNGHVCELLRASSCGGDAVRIVSGASNIHILNSFLRGNTGYGVNDLDSSSVLLGNHLDLNTAGAINGTPAVGGTGSGLNKET